MKQNPKVDLKCGRYERCVELVPQAFFVCPHSGFDSLPCAQAYLFPLSFGGYILQIRCGQDRDQVQVTSKGRHPINSGTREQQRFCSISSVRAGLGGIPPCQRPLSTFKNIRGGKVRLNPRPCGQFIDEECSY